MFEALNKLMLAGLGAVEMTRETAEKVFDELVRKGEAHTPNRAAMVQDLMDTAAATRRQMREFVDRQVGEAVAGLNLPTRDDLQRVEAKLDRLLAMKTPADSETTRT
jgi:poly(hydroxyalkanoate) granule-associated protein